MFGFVWICLGFDKKVLKWPFHVTHCEWFVPSFETAKNWGSAGPLQQVLQWTWKRPEISRDGAALIMLLMQFFIQCHWFFLFSSFRIPHQYLHQSIKRLFERKTHWPSRVMINSMLEYTCLQGLLLARWMGQRNPAPVENGDLSHYRLEKLQAGAGSRNHPQYDPLFCWCVFSPFCKHTSDGFGRRSQRRAQSDCRQETEGFSPFPFSWCCGKMLITDWEDGIKQKQFLHHQ